MNLNQTKGTNSSALQSKPATQEIYLRLLLEQPTSNVHNWWDVRRGYNKTDLRISAQSALHLKHLDQFCFGVYLLPHTDSLPNVTHFLPLGELFGVSSHNFTSHFYSSCIYKQLQVLWSWPSFNINYFASLIFDIYPSLPPSTDEQKPWLLSAFPLLSNEATIFGFFSSFPQPCWLCSY